MFGARPGLIKNIESPQPARNVEKEDAAKDLQARIEDIKAKGGVKQIVANPDHEITSTLMDLRKKYGSYKDLFAELADRPEFGDLIDSGYEEALVLAACSTMADIEPATEATH